MMVLVQLEYPFFWQNLLPEIITKIKTAKETIEIYGAIRLVYTIFRTYKYEIDQK